MSLQFVSRSIVVVDVERYSSRDNPGQVYVRQDLARVLGEAFEAASVAPPSEQQDGGDGYLTLFPAEVSKVVLLDTLPRQLAGALARLNRDRVQAGRLRVRLAMHAGEVHLDGTGYPGEAVVHAARLCDAAVLRSALRASAGDLVVAVSDALYQAVVRHGYGALNSGDYVAREVSEKEFRGQAWIQSFPRGERDPEPGGLQDAPDRESNPTAATERQGLDVAAVAAEIGRSATFFGPTSFGGPAAGRDVNIDRRPG